MKSHPVGRDVNQPKIDHSHLVTRVDETLDLNLSLFQWEAVSDKEAVTKRAISDFDVRLLLSVLAQAIAPGWYFHVLPIVMT